MALKDWHPVQIGLFWFLLAIFALPTWLVLALLGGWLAGRYPYQRWFETIPTVLAFLVVFSVVAVGLSVTWKWLDARQTRPPS